MQELIFLTIILCFIYKVIGLFVLESELEEFQATLINLTGSIPLHNCLLLDFYKGLRQDYQIPDSIVLYLANHDPENSIEGPEMAFASLNLFRRKSLIFLFLEFAELISANALKFVVAHEVGHILDRKNNVLHFILFPRCRQRDKRDLLADAFAAGIVGKWNGILALEEIDSLYTTDQLDVTIRIMALYMPTLFFKYA